MGRKTKFKFKFKNIIDFDFSPAEYNSEASTSYKLLPSYENLVEMGPDRKSQQSGGGGGGGAQEDESDLEDGDDDQPSEDHHALLVKAWEQKVFPTIRRRFRNEAERKDGLEQIRGALQLGKSTGCTV